MAFRKHTHVAILRALQQQRVHRQDSIGTAALDATKPTGTSIRTSQWELATKLGPTNMSKSQVALGSRLSLDSIKDSLQNCTQTVGAPQACRRSIPISIAAVLLEATVSCSTRLAAAMLAISTRALEGSAAILAHHRLGWMSVPPQAPVLLVYPSGFSSRSSLVQLSSLLSFASSSSSASCAGGTVGIAEWVLKSAVEVPVQVLCVAAVQIQHPLV
jgi:hypothetical protein